MTPPNPPTKTRRTVAVCLAVLLAVSLSGCAGLTRLASPQSQSQPTLPGAEEAAEQRTSLDSLSATVRTVQRTEEGTVTTVDAVKHRLDPLGYRSRTRSVRSNTTGRVYATEGHLTVSNETTTTLYRPEEQSVSYIVRTDTDGREDVYLDILAAARGNETIPQPTPGVPSLPRVPRDDDAESNGNGSTSYRDQLVRVRYNGTETVDDRRTYRLEVDPVSPNASLKDQTLWLDTAYLYPLKRHVEFVTHGDRYEYRTTYRNVTFNPEFAPETFRLDRDRLSPEVEETWFRSYGSLAAAAANVTMPVPDPAVPEGYELERVNHRSGGPEMLMLTYERHGDERPIRIAVVGETRSRAGDANENDTVEIGGHAARLGHDDGITHVGWSADGYAYTVQGSVDNGTLVRIARSVAATT